MHLLHEPIRPMNSSPDDPIVASALAGLVGDRLHAVTFILDFVQLQFDDHALNAYSPLSVVRGQNVVRQGWQAFRNELCGQISKRVNGCRLAAKYLEIAFDDVQVRLSLADEDSVGPEAAHLFTPNAEIIFGTDRIHTIPKA
jgi:hypothetical protein